MSLQKITTILCDTDMHGMTCGLNAVYALMRTGINVTIFSHFSTNPNELTTTPTGLAQVIQNLGQTNLIILDIPIDIRNPKAYIDALISHAQFKGCILWADHHGHSQWVDILNKNGIIAIIVGSSYDLSMLIPRMYNVVDSFVEKWSLIGALSDFDSSIAIKVDRTLEEDVCDILDQAYKTKLNDIMKMLDMPIYTSHGNIGSLIHAIIVKQLEPEQLINIAKQLVKPLQLPQYEIVGDIVYTTQLPPGGLAWKTAWKLCLVTGSKVAIVPTFNPRTNQYAIIIARYWKTDENVAKTVDEFVTTKFTGRQIVGHLGARSIALMNQNELQLIPQIARELDEEIRRKIYTPRITRLISDQYVAQSIVNDFKIILQKITEILESQKRMYEEYLKLKEEQVKLLRQVRETRAD